MGLDSIAILALGVVTLWVAFLTVAVLNRGAGQKKLVKAADDGNLGGVIAEALKDIGNLDGRLDVLTNRLEAAIEESRGAVQRVGLVRFDAFEDVGGKLSFSVALLDDRGDGFILTALNGRDTSRCYSKEIKGKNSQVDLSDEENLAISKAMSTTDTLVKERA